MYNKNIEKKTICCICFSFFTVRHIIYIKKLGQVICTNKSFQLYLKTKLNCNKKTTSVNANKQCIYKYIVKLELKKKIGNIEKLEKISL